MYGAPLFILAVFLCSFKAQFQGVIVALSVLWVTNETQLGIVLVFSVISVLYGRFRSAAESG